MNKALPSAISLASVLIFFAACASPTPTATPTPTPTATPTATPTHAPPDPQSVVAAYVEAFNSADIDALVALYADDVVFLIEGLSEFTGKAAVLGEVLDVIASGGKLAISNTTVEGNIVKGDSSISIDGTLFTGTVELEVEEGKITRSKFTPAPPNETGPAALFRQLVDAVNAGSPPLAAVLFADDGLVELVDVKANGNVGRETLQDFFGGFVFIKSRFTIISSETSGDTASGRVEVTWSQLQEQGTERIVDLFTVEVKGGKISRLRLQFDLTDLQTSGVFAFFKAQPQQGGHPPDVRWMPMGPGRDADQSGIATVGAPEDMPIGGVAIDIAPGAASVLQPAHIHSGSCDNLGPIVLPLVSLLNGKSFTHISKPRVSEFLKGEFAINVHQSAEEHDVYVACGNIGEPLVPAPGQEALPLIFGEVDGSGIGGTVTIIPLADGRLLVEAETTGLREGVRYVSGVYDEMSLNCRGDLIGSVSGWFNTEYPAVSYIVPGPLENVGSVSVQEVEEDSPGVVRACAQRSS